MELWDSIIRMVSALAVVLGLMTLMALLLRRLLPFRRRLLSGAPLVQVLGTGYLGPRKSIAVVAVAGEVFIIAESATQLMPMGRLKDPARLGTILPDWQTAPEPPEDARPSQPRHWLAHAFKVFEDQGVWRVAASPPKGHLPNGHPQGWLAKRLAFLERKGQRNVRLREQPAHVRRGKRVGEQKVSL